MKGTCRRKVRPLIAVIAALTAICILTGCGSKKPTAEDAQNYTKAVLDMMCTGDYDHSVKLADVEEGQESALRDDVINDAMDSLGSVDISDSVKEEFRDLIDNALKKCKYTVGEAASTGEDGEYDVTVTIEPLKLFDGLEDALAEELADVIYDPEKMAAMSDREFNDLVYSTMIRMMAEKVETPSYSAPEDVVVHYGLLDAEKNLYGISEEDGEKLGEKLFSTEGLE